MSISDVLKRQAAAIKNQDNNIAAAEKLEEAARILRGLPPKEEATFKFQASHDKKSRGAALEKFGAAIGKWKKQDRETALKTAGWVKVSYNEKEGWETWGQKENPGKQLKISGKHFAVLYGTETLQPKTELEFLASYLQKQGSSSNPKTNKSQL